MVTMTDTNTPRRSQRGEYAKSELTRGAILDAALEVFAQGGYRAGSLREIAQRVGMSEAGLLHHFKNKSTLLLAVLDHRDEQSRQIVNFDDADGVETLRALVKLARYNASIPGVIELFCTLSAEATSPSHPAHEYFLRRYEYVRESITVAFRRIAAEGRLIREIDPYRAAVATTAMMDGLQVQWLLDPTSTDMADALAEFFRGYVRGYDLDALEQLLDARAAESLVSGEGSGSGATL
ncbi:TetR family transcriptional regulator [Microbacterium sp. AG790]|nr:TetR family transcriptional regulator [Microbacterium sp. AG790]